MAVLKKLSYLPSDIEAHCAMHMNDSCKRALKNLTTLQCTVWLSIPHTHINTPSYWCVHASIHAHKPILPHMHPCIITSAQLHTYTQTHPSPHMHPHGHPCAHSHAPLFNRKRTPPYLHTSPSFLPRTPTHILHTCPNVGVYKAAQSWLWWLRTSASHSSM